MKLLFKGVQFADLDHCEILLGICTFGVPLTSEREPAIISHRSGFRADSALARDSPWSRCRDGIATKFGGRQAGGVLLRLWKFIGSDCVGDALLGRSLSGLRKISYGV